MDAIKVAKVERVILERADPAPPHERTQHEGTLHLTPHHLLFCPTPPAHSEEELDEVWIPYPTVNRLQRLPLVPSGDKPTSGRFPLVVGTKTFDNYILYFTRDREGGAEDVWQSVRDCAVSSSVENLYAFFYHLPPAEGSKTPQATTSALPLSTSPEKPSTEPVAHAPPPKHERVASAGAGEGWAAFNPRSEFARQGVGSRTKAWRFTDVNKDYAFCPTYPAKLVVPSRISDSVLSYAAKYRSKARIPALSYLHWANHASITRSSQPMVGIKNARSAQDERLIECIFTSHLSPDTAFATTSNSLSPSPSSSALPSPSSSHIYGATTTNLIIDARPTTNAVANVAKGAGTENMEWYKSGKKAYLGIDNIHVMRNSLKTVVSALTEADETGAPLDRERLRKSGWIKHIGGILEGAALIVKNVHVNSSHVLIHCSDGWDRTSQLSAIAQVCLDPYYRTLEGFKVLVEKDWLSFGHMFLQRSGHLSSTKLFTATPDNIDGDEESDDDFGNAVKGVTAFFGSVTKSFSSSSHLKEISPVFHQFLDAVRQIQRQHPERFEFNEEYLLDLMFHLYSCQFGTFLFDNERTRRVAHGHKGAYTDRTVSAWEWFDRPEQRERYLNAEYKPELDDRNARDHDADLGVLFIDAKDVKFWHRLFKRTDDDMNATRFPAQDVAPVIEGSADPLVDAEAGLVAEELGVAKEGVARRPSPVRQDSASTPASASPFARLGGISARLPASPSQTWNWTQLSSAVGTVGTGAMSAFSTIRATATDAISQLRDEREEEMGSYAPGTGIGEGRHPPSRSASGALPSRNVRIPSEANPWGAPEEAAPAAKVAPLAKPEPESSTWAPSAPVNNSTGANPWGDPTPAKGLADLSLSDAAAKPSQPPPRKSSLKRSDEDKALEAAALGGDSKAWDPLGAL
ncbi:Phosphoinositide 3-phosphatase [Vanrija pseudolonga]|uniref:Phosphoinositide 3-phosphatase n=1 Tax=Vanrija pseudolonga TaxID=143232 RepID=A0AAF1BS65_9TREE|nr:Phosphoinositide 3-phosphatase [Vanrija pseudolonga]